MSIMLYFNDAIKYLFTLKAIFPSIPKVNKKLNALRGSNELWHHLIRSSTRRHQLRLYTVVGLHNY